MLKRLITTTAFFVGVVLIPLGALALIHGGLRPDAVEVAIGLVLLILGVVLASGAHHWLSVLGCLVVLLALPAIAGAHPPGGSQSGHNEYRNWDSAYSRIGHKRVFSTILVVAYHWDVRKHKVWVDNSWIEPSLTSLGSDEGWEYKGVVARQQSCFRVPGRGNGYYGQGGCGVMKEVQWQTCVVKCFNKYRTLRSFVYWDGNVAFKNG